MGKQLVETFDTQYSLETRRPDLTVNVAATVKDGFACQKGDVLGEITSSGLMRRRSRSLVTGTAFATTSPTGTVADGSVFKVGDALTNAAGAAVGTVQSIVGNTITLAANAAVAVATGAAVLGSDGSQIAAVIAEEGSDGNGDTPINVITQSPALDVSKLRGLDDSAITDLGGKKLPGNLLKF